jgi:hypothetical protein
VFSFSHSSSSQIALARTDIDEKYQDHNAKLYQAPEVLVGGTLTEKSLIWTIGVIVDEMFVGRRVFRKFSEILS